MTPGSVAVVLADTASVVLAAGGPLQTVFLGVVAVTALALAVAVRLLVRRSIRESHPEEPPTQPDDLEPGQR